MDDAERFADNMVGRVGSPSHLEQLLAAAVKKAGTRRYSVQIIKTEGGVPCEQSRIEHDAMQDGTSLGGRIYICASAGSDATWDLLHELGHALHGHEPGKEQQCGHETLMWEKGWRWASSSAHGASLTADDKARFRDRAHYCLKSYCGDSVNLTI